ncbi:MAG: tRNA (N(6)-L-threonylcarbamoyladenosine(37)-C(2))-methylthiotransferase [Candidatus Aenigmatarchaeota archaeon]
MKKIYIETYGCSSSRNDGEIMSGLLSNAGFQLVDDIDNADVIIINTCIVKQPTESKIVSRIKALQGRKLIIAGCMPEAEYDIAKRAAPDANLISTNRVHEIAKVVKKTIAGEKVELLGKLKKEKVCLPKLRKNSVVDVVEICSGCNNTCSYCIVKLAKGSLFSYSPKSIIKEISAGVADGCKEFWLTGQDVAAYCYDGKRLPSLLGEITKVRKDFFLRAGMMNPSNVLPMLDELIDSYRNEKLFKFIHLPVQSGSNRVLKTMNRKYTVAEYKIIVKKLRKAIPEITLWTDVIVGFPGESESDFLKTLSLIKEIRPDFTNISQFGVRPGTKSAAMKQLPTEIKKERSKKMTEAVGRICLERNERWLGWSGHALVDEYNEGKNNWIARNYAYKPIAVKSGGFGKTINVTIAGAEKTCLIAR